MAKRGGSFVSVSAQALHDGASTYFIVEGNDILVELRPIRHL